MDETTKILIGTISGFIIAFFAEPVKVFFQTISRRKNLRRMLYQEVFENYSRLKNIEGNEGSGKVFKKVATSFVKMDCYRYAIATEIAIYYQLREAVSFNTLYATLQNLLDIDLSPKLRNGLMKLYSIKLSEAIESGDIDIRYLLKLRAKSEVNGLLNQLKTDQ